MDWTRTIDEILAVFTDGADVVFKTRAGRTFRVYAESFIPNAKTYVVEKMNVPVRILHMGERCEFIFAL
jgi:hypothetical protein